MNRATVILLLLAAACGKDAPPKSAAPAAPRRAVLPTTSAEYRVVVKSTWTPVNQPFEYPSDAHFSGLIGASHNSKYSIFAIGRRPTRGLERLSEEGKHSPLNDEIHAAMTAGSALAIFETGGLKNFKDSLVTTVRVDPTHPLISVVAMVAPSPDWFTGAANVNMIENGEWVRSRRWTMPAYDSGGDDGTTYKARDRDTNPKKPTSRASPRHFVRNGTVRPVAVLVLTRISP